MNIIKNALKNKKLPMYLIALVALGGVALMLNRLAARPEIDFAASMQPQEHYEEVYHLPPYFQHEQALEARLEEFFSLVEGAGRVRVMVSPIGGRESVFAVDVNQSRNYSKEEDAQGGSRETHQQTSQQQTVIITDRQGTDRPLVLREIEPRIEGIVIIAEGGGRAEVRDALTRAARAVLGIEPHMIQVLPKQN